MFITFCEAEEWEKNYFEKALADCELQFLTGTLNADSEEDVSQTEVLATFIYSKIDARLLKKMPNLKLVITRSTGFDHIDLTACEERGILVANVPNYGENTVAEHAFSLILALSRKIIPSVDKVRHGEFNVDGLRGFDLFGKTIGIIGTGKIGARVASIAHGLGMEIIGYDINQNQSLIKDFSLKYVTLDELLANSDVISLNMRHTAETHHLIKKETLAKIKKGAILVNTARGGLIDTPELLPALENGTLAGVGLDVLEDEGSIKEDMQILSKHFPKRSMMVSLANNILMRRPNVIITPHNAFNSDEALERIMDTTIENIRAFQQDNPINIVANS